MPEAGHGDVLVAIATIIGALVGVLGTYLVEHFRKTRRSILFNLAAPEDLASALRERGNSFEVKVNEVTTQSLVAAGVTVKNTGNTTISDISFDLVIPGRHTLALVDIISDNAKLKSAIKIDFGPELPPRDPSFRVSVAFFNPGEAFKLATFSDGAETRCEIACRLPEVKTKTVTEEDVARKMASIDVWAAILSKSATGIGAGSAALLIASLFKLFNS